MTVYNVVMTQTPEPNEIAAADQAEAAEMAQIEEEAIHGTNRMAAEMGMPPVYVPVTNDLGMVTGWKFEESFKRVLDANPALLDLIKSGGGSFGLGRSPQ
jgi:DhnA family fructose-bisphosphate aldolase class Ia